MRNLFYLIAFSFLVSAGCESKKSPSTETSEAIDTAGVPTAVNNDSCKDVKYVKYAHAYNNYIVEKQGNILQDHIAFIKAVKRHESMDMTDDLYQNLVDQTKISIDSLEKLCAFNGNTTFKNAAIDLFRFYQEAWGSYIPLMDIKNKKERVKILADLKTEFNNTHSIREKKLEEEFMKAHTNFVNEYKLHVRSTSLHESIDSLLSSK